MTEKGTRRRVMRRRDPAGSTTRRKKSAMRRAVRSLKSAGFTVGRKLVIAGSAPTVAIAFPNYIRAKRDHFRRSGEPTIAYMFSAIAIEMR